MTAERTDRRPVRIRRRGRHTSPSQVGKVAQQAGKAAPAVAIAGALVAAPSAQSALAGGHPAATTATASGYLAPGAGSAAGTAGTGTATASLDSFQSRAVTVASARPAKHSAAAKTTRYQVRSGDSLSAIASRYYHNAAAWQYLYHENEKTISNPDMLYVGQELLVPATAPAHYTLSGYAPRHAKPARETRTAGGSTSDSAARGSSVIVQAAAQGHYSCSGLEQIWEAAGGSSARAFTAAEIAMAESGGNPNAISPTDDFGLWQINGVNGALATLNAYQNARSAVILSGNGTNWDPWTTYTSGAYSGRC